MTGERPLTLVTPSGDELETIVDVRDVTRRFRVGDEDVWAVRDVSLHIGRGTFVALMGRSGSGKTTLLNLLAGLDHPDRGTIRLAGQDITSASEPQLLEVRRHTIGFVFQSFGLLPLLSAFENVEVALRIAGVGLGERRERTQELLRMVDLHARSDHRPLRAVPAGSSSAWRSRGRWPTARARRRRRAHGRTRPRQRPRHLPTDAGPGAAERRHDRHRHARPHRPGLRRAGGGDGRRPASWSITSATSPPT